VRRLSGFVKRARQRAAISSLVSSKPSGSCLPAERSLQPRPMRLRARFEDYMPEAQSVATTSVPRDERTVELSARRTGMSFQRTRLSAERTLMSTVRTSLSLISFGFTIFQFLRRLKDTQILESGTRAPRNFGLALVGLGVCLLTVGIAYHVAFMRELRLLRKRLKHEGIVHGESLFPVSLTLLMSLALLIIGLLAIASIAFHVGPFG
jgi:putative membrane protein